MADDYQQTSYYNTENTSGNSRNGEFYHEESGTDSQGNPGTWHDYADGTKEFIAAPPPVQVISQTPQPATAAPVAAAPPAPAPAAPSQPTVASSTPQPESGFTPPPPPAFDHSNPNVYENPTTHDVYQVADAGPNGQWHVYQSGPPQWVGAPNHTGMDLGVINNLTPAQYAAQQAAAPPSSSTATSQTPTPIIGGGLPTSGSSSSINDRPVVGITDPNIGPQRPETPITGSIGAGGTAPLPTIGITDPNIGPQRPEVSITNTDSGGTLAPASDGNTYTVTSDDRLKGLTGVSEKTGVPLSQLEALNPQFKSNFSLIHVGDQVNLGGPSTEVAQPLSSPSSGFPPHSTYPTSDNPAGHEAAKVEQAGWSSGTDSGTSDPTKSIMEADTKADTDPLKINNSKPH